MKQERPHLLFVMETKITAKRVEDMQIILGFASCYTVVSVGLSGDIGLFWSNDLDVDNKNLSTCNIDAMVRMKSDIFIKWRFTGFSRASRVEDQHHSWRFVICYPSLCKDMPW